MSTKPKKKAIQVKKAAKPKTATNKKVTSKKVAKAKPSAAPVSVVSEKPLETVVPPRPEKAPELQATKGPRLKGRIIAAVVIIALVGLVVLETAVIISKKSSQERAFIQKGSFGMRGGDFKNRMTYNGVVILKITNQDKLFLVDNILGRILMYDAKTKEYVLTIDKTQTGKDNFKPFDVDSDSQGNIYAMDATNQEIVVFSPKGELLRNWSAPLCNAITIDQEDNILVTDGNKMQIVRYNSEGQIIDRIGGKGKGRGKFLHVYHMDVDDKGNVYVLDLSKKKVQIFSNKGKFICDWSLDFTPNTLSALFVKDQIVYINDFEGQMVWAYSIKGKLVWRIAAKWPVSPVQDSQNNYYMPDISGVGYFSLEKR
ncbi:6-bladed beta-propeller [bacterium]|nr:6-bladed beta-propeller [bacterium]